MNFLRHNIVTLILVVTVAGVTGLNSYTTKRTVRELHNSSAYVAFSQTVRCDQLEQTLTRLYQDHVQVIQAANEMYAELQMLREAMKQAGIAPPEPTPSELEMEI